MKSIFRTTAVLALLGAPLLLSGCANDHDAIERAQSTANQAMSTAQSAQQTAQQADQKADRALSEIHQMQQAPPPPPPPHEGPRG